MRFVCRHGTAGQNHLHGFVFADRASQALRSAGTGDDTDIDFGLAELSAFRSDDDVACHHELATTAKRVAANRGNNRLLHFPDFVPGGESVFEHDAYRRLVRHLADISTSGEGALSAREDNNANAILFVKILERHNELFHKLVTEGVQHLWTIEGDDTNGAITISQDIPVCYVFHFVFPRQRLFQLVRLHSERVCRDCHCLPYCAHLAALRLWATLIRTCRTHHRT